MYREKEKENLKKKIKNHHWVRCTWSLITPLLCTCSWSHYVPAGRFAHRIGQALPKALFSVLHGRHVTETEVLGPAPTHLQQGHAPVEGTFNKQMGDVWETLGPNYFHTYYLLHWKERSPCILRSWKADFTTLVELLVLTAQQEQAEP